MIVLSASIFRLDISVPNAFCNTPICRISLVLHVDEDHNAPLVCKQMCIYSSLFQNWLAYDVLPASWNITERGKLHFSGLGAPKKENNYAFCQVGNKNSFLYVSDEPLFNLDHLRRKIVSLIFTETLLRCISCFYEECRVFKKEQY